MYATVIGRSFLSSSRSVVVLFTIFSKSKPALKHFPLTYIRSSVSHSQCPPTQLLTNVVLTLTSAIVPTCTIGNMTSNEWETRNLMWTLTPAKHSRLVSVKATCWEWTYYNMWHGDGRSLGGWSTWYHCASCSIVVAWWWVRGNPSGISVTNSVIENRELMVVVISYDDHACLSHHPTSYWKHSDIFVEYASTANFDIFNQPP